ncbi:MAG TPA: class I SAM-dependent methyltransferase [Gaiellales bacterium]|jgi:SAM-dependent methyltransferase
MSDPPLDALAASFGRVADDYDRGRPSYPPEALDWLVAELRVGASSTVVDLAAGTGKLTAGLVSRAGHVIAVEPVAEMRRVLEARTPAAEVRVGTAEAIPLPADAADAVLVGAAFHWFSADAALAEIHRVLRTGGGLGLLWNRPEWEGEPWYPAFADVLERARAAQDDPPNRYSVGEWRAALERSLLFGPARKREFRHVQRATRAEFLARVASWSVVAVMPEDARTTILEELDGDLAARRIAALDLRYRTDTYRALARPATGSG